MPCSFLLVTCERGGELSGCQWSRYSAATTSINKCAFGCVRKIDAGQLVLIGPATVFLIACRLAGPGAMANNLGRAINVGIVNDKASLGTSSSEANAPSLTCWFLQTSSSWTTLTASGSLKSQNGGSMNAR